MAVCTAFVQEHPESSRTAETTAEVLKIRARQLSTGKGGKSGPGYALLFRYSVAGRTYEQRSQLFRDDWQPSQPLKVCYNPDDPPSASARPIAFHCGDTWPPAHLDEWKPFWVPKDP